MELLLYILGATSEFALCSPPQLMQFGGSRLVCCNLSRRAVGRIWRTWGGSTAVGWWVPKNWQLKHWRMGREFLYFSHLSMQWHSLWSWRTLRISVFGWNVTTNIGYLFVTVLVVLSIFLSWVTCTVWTLWVASSSLMSSSGRFGGMPFRTNRGWVFSGSGYVWYASWAVRISVSRVL